MTPEQQAWIDKLARGDGWKLHLNFDPEDAAKSASVSDLLTSLKEQGSIAGFKIGHGGGKAAGAPGKEATVYVGPCDQAAYVAHSVGALLEPVLDAPEGDTLEDDTPFTEKVVGRFDVGSNRGDLDFLQYGWQGVPFMK